ncbi:sugar nucleotide-binding protein [bacterium]|nr:sugar nucleotide-binding protein [bacterium]
MSKVVILGDGILGKELHNQTGWDVISRSKNGFDALTPDFNSLVAQEHGVIFYPKYTTIVNCIANTDSYSDDLQPHLDINYKFVTSLVDFCKEWKIKLVHISTEFVYANNDILPKETDLPIPDNTWYAKTKLLADYYISAMCNDYLICRELHKSNNFAPPQVWDVKTNGDKVSNIAEILVKLINKKATGIFNVGTYEKSLKDIVPKSKPILPPKHVPLDTRMDITKLKQFLK